MNFKCIKPWDTNETLKATFRFIYNYQSKASGDNIETIIYLAPALKKSQNYDNYNNREEVFNIIYGKITKVLENYFEIETVSACTELKQYYTVAYSDILNIRSGVLTKYFDEYLAYMNCLPSICSCYGNKYYDLLTRLEKEIEMLNPMPQIYLIYGGRFSLGYNKEEYIIVKNLIVIQKNGLVPITAVAGFFTAPNKTVQKISLEDNTDRGCN